MMTFLGVMWVLAVLLGFTFLGMYTLGTHLECKDQKVSITHFKSLIATQQQEIANLTRRLETRRDIINAYLDDAADSQNVIGDLRSDVDDRNDTIAILLAELMVRK